MPARSGAVDGCLSGPRSETFRARPDGLRGRPGKVAAPWPRLRPRLRTCHCCVRPFLGTTRGRCFLNGVPERHHGLKCWRAEDDGGLPHGTSSGIIRPPYGDANYLATWFLTGWPNTRSSRRRPCGTPSCFVINNGPLCRRDVHFRSTHVRSAKVGSVKDNAT